ncbi:MAG TPA: HAMP domain-containing sensor histidine kinase, partial [Gemmatimonadaceae bacterium]|nr:HAMP domain-containing sensor histidine kinase [Gemmatimonadaceae bacterium]
MRESAEGDDDTLSESTSVAPALAKRWWLPTAFAILSLLLLLIVPAVINFRVSSVRGDLAQSSEHARVLLNDLEAAFASQLLVRNSTSATLAPPAFALPRHLESDQVELRTALAGSDAKTISLYDSLDLRLSAWSASPHDSSSLTARQGLELLGAAERLDSALAVASQSRRAEVARLERYFVLAPSVLAPIALIAILIVVSSGQRMRHFAELAQEERVQMLRAVETRAALLRGVTHDVKNPLGAAAGYAQLLEEGLAGPLEPSQIRMVQKIQTLVQSAVQTVTDLLELARADGKLHIEYAQGDLAQLLEGVVDDHVGMARAKQIDILVGARRTPIVTDPLRVRQILTNLLSNAIKYSPHGARVELKIVSSEGAERIADCVGVEVRDSGPGIPVELQSKVFQEFFRVRSGNDAPNGNGLGLAISRRIALLLGGDVRFIEAENGGAIFTLWLPSKRRQPDG